MFGWLFGSSKKPVEDSYQKQERLLYKYFDGKKEVLADPMVLWCKLMEKSTDLSGDMQVAASISKDRIKARYAMIEKIKWIFSVKSHEEGGLTQSECEYLLQDFVNWCDQLKKNLNLTPISPTETSQHTKPLLEENQPTGNTSDFGSIENEISNEGHIPSLSEMQ